MACGRRQDSSGLDRPNRKRKFLSLTPDLITTALIYLGTLREVQGNFAEAHRYYNRSLEISTQAGNQINMAMSLNEITLVYQNWGNHGEALKNFRESLKIECTPPMFEGAVSANIRSVRQRLQKNKSG